MDALRYYPVMDQRGEPLADEDDYADFLNWSEEEDEHHLRECIYLDGMQPGDDYFDEHVEKFVNEIRSAQTTWPASSPLRARLIENLHRNRTPESQVSKAVLCALGPISGNDSEFRKLRPIYQLVMFLDMIQELEMATNKKIELYAQDPVFKELDKAVLRRLDFTILEYPGGEELYRSSTFYFVAYGGFEWELLTSSDRPALMVGLRYSKLYRNMKLKKRGRKRDMRDRLVQAKRDYRREAICPEDDEEIAWREYITFGRLMLWCKQSVDNDSQAIERRDSGVSGLGCELERVEMDSTAFLPAEVNHAVQLTPCAPES